MPCPICDQKPANCDCTDAEKRMYAETEDLEIEIERLRAERRWIPVSERLPEPYERVIGWAAPWARAGETWRNDSGGWLCGDCEPAGDVSHWMQLPEPPSN